MQFCLFLIYLKFTISFFLNPLKVIQKKPYLILLSQHHLPPLYAANSKDFPKRVILPTGGTVWSL